MKKRILPHMYVISSIPTGGFLVTLGDPRDTESRIIRGPLDEYGVFEWKMECVGESISENHVIDVTTQFGIAPDWTDFYVKTCG